MEWMDTNIDFFYEVLSEGANMSRYLKGLMVSLWRNSV